MDPGDLDTIINNLVNAGFSYKGKTLFFETEKPRWEALVLLNRDDREIFAKFDKRTRNKIRSTTCKYQKKVVSLHQICAQVPQKVIQSIN